MIARLPEGERLVEEWRVRNGAEPGHPTVLEVRFFGGQRLELHVAPEEARALSRVLSLPHQPSEPVRCGRCGCTTRGTREGDSEYCTVCGAVLGPASTAEAPR